MKEKENLDPNSVNQQLYKKLKLIKEQKQNIAISKTQSFCGALSTVAPWS
jgi:hypothetical protein